MAVLTADEIRQFNEEGYLTLDTGLPCRELFDSVVAELAGEYPDSGDEAELDLRIQDAWKTNRFVHEIAIAPRLMDALRELYHRDPRPFQTINFPVGTEQAAHSDTLHFNSLPHSYMCGVWVALEDMDENNGPVFYYPKSHMLPEFTMLDVGVEPSPENYVEYEKFIEKGARQFGLVPHLATVAKGQALIWAANLLHGGAPRKDPNRTRHSQVTHYFFDGCMYYTPMMSRGFDVAWRDPEWIPTTLPPR